ncbi:thioredoxin domain-containing protein [Cytophaga aurantiaca]|uniref:thioredoxin domain-containing protein n=1 Tax=Cytophaga aurantiaca TaxID=29530 RepID=UPI000365C7A8|nr:thioredoxin domain-containing protein [Cytophaga aurantiaca]
MKKYFLRIVVVFVVALSACSNQQQAQALTETADSVKLSAVAFDEKLKNTKDAILLDVRTPDEFSEAHIQNATNVDWNNADFKTKVAQLDKSKPVFVYCLRGGRSSSSIEFLQANGFQQVYELEGGILKWKDANLPLVSAAAPTETDATEDMTLVEFQKLLLTDKYVLVDFYATWCGPCKQMEPDLEDIAETMKDKVVVIRIDVDKNPTISKHFEIESLPTLQIYKGQKLVWEDIGYKTKKQLLKELK